MGFGGRTAAFAAVAGFWLCGMWPQAMVAQQVSYEHATPAQLAGIAKDNSRHFGDDPDDAGPIATDLSGSLDPAAVGKAMRKVGDWQMARSEQYFDRIWTWSVLYSGFMAGLGLLGGTEKPVG